MKFDWNRFMSTRTISNILVVCFGILVYFFFLRFTEIREALSWFLSILYPFILGFVIAYLVNFLVVFFENKFFKKVKRPRHRRVYAMLLGYFLALVLFFLFLFMITPQLVESLMSFFNQIPSYLDNLSALVSSLSLRFGIQESVYRVIADYIDQLEEKVPEIISLIVPYTLDFTAKLSGFILNFFIAIIVSIYFIATKEKFMAQIKKTLFALMKKEKAERLLGIIHFSNQTFGGFVSGKLLDSLIVGIICFVVLSLFDYPYVLLVSVIIGVTNIIPFFGPIIGAFPAFFIILFADPTRALWFPLFILILQQLDGNIIGPKILGESTGLSAIWVVFAIIICGKLFGFVGMVLGVPMVAILYSLFKESVENRLRNKNLSANTNDYASEDHKIRF